jgi:hypothetical protein
MDVKDGGEVSESAQLRCSLTSTKEGGVTGLGWALLSPPLTGLTGRHSTIVEQRGAILHTVCIA